jgi:glucokinase
MKVMEPGTFAVGVDLGGSKIGIGLVDSAGKIHRHVRLVTDVSGGFSAIQEQIASGVREMKKSLKGHLVGIGVGIPGQIEKGKGTVLFAPNLNWHGVPLGENLNKLLSLPVVLINDVRAAAWGEWLYGAARGCSDFICVFIGTGIGGGIVSNGLMLEGCGNTSGEIGHMVVHMDGPLCTCGGRGCLEAFAGGWAIAKRAREAVHDDPEGGHFLLKLAGGDPCRITASLLFQAAEAHDPLASDVFGSVVKALIAGGTSLVNAFNPCRLIFGGGVVDGAPELVPLIEKGVRQYGLPAATARLQVLPSLLRAEAGIVGGAALAFHTFIHKD